ncbi:uncharacterized protein LOC118261725 [Spodoptera frugiperda]|uniref:Uncharacterized protein LOC118261725 n=1 Tax=Spodoptera frugiperda TaxID=7108 RepID=A0A9R0CTC2_SPOFR|nr:uncharacterized protein LOC118261725 [Spodoptera frugiperda]
MIYLKCLVVISSLILPVFCNNTVPVTTLEPTEDGIGTDSIDMTTVIVSTSYNPTATTELLDGSNVTTEPTVVENENVTFRSVNKTTSAIVKRRVLIINKQILRQSSKKKRRGKKNQDQDPRLATVESLLYEEYDKDGEKIVEIMMNNMEDVSKFFQSYLHTQVCYGQCDP